MALTGSIQSIKDLINEEKLENTHYMDFNHEGMTHINILRAQGKLWCYYDKNLECIRKLILILNTELLHQLKPETFFEDIINVSKMFSIDKEIVNNAINLQKIYNQIPKNDLAKKSYSVTNFS
jgi:hypothetical protein